MGGDEVGLAVHGEGGRAIPGLWFFRRFPAGQQHEESEAHGKEQAGGQGGPAEPFPLFGRCVGDSEPLITDFAYGPVEIFPVHG